MKRTLAYLLGAALMAGCGGGGEADVDGASGAFDASRAFGDLQAQVEIGPRPRGSAAGAEEVRLIVRRLREAGVHGVRVQRPYRNVVGRIPGRAPGAVVVGAHHDTKDIPGFLGANDGASGVAVVLELARALPSRLDGPSVHLVLFDAEEARDDRPFEVDGVRGSRQYVAYARRGGRQGSAPLDEIRAMVLFDLVGDCALRIPRESSSDRRLYGLFAGAVPDPEAASSPFEGTTGAVLDDHTPFLEAGVPAVDLIDFDYGPGPPPGGWWHTRDDTLDKVCPESLDVVGEAALRAIPRIR